MSPIPTATNPVLCYLPHMGVYECMPTQMDKLYHTFASFTLEQLHALPPCTKALGAHGAMLSTRFEYYMLLAQ